ncbi:MAG TPA: extracellular solute-binding protein [Thermodesulfobacteriota bacterium]|nr:extracellular solute-binding protein [Thermodesulfobacteriota bacterium]
MRAVVRSVRLLAGPLWLAGLLWLAPAPAPAQELAALEEGARREGKLNLYGSMREDEATKVFEAFNRRYPFVKIDYFRGSEDRLTGRILAEARAGTHNFDVLVTTTAYHLKGLDLAVRWQPPEAAAIRPELRDPDGRLTPIYVNTNVIMYNTKLVPPAEAPKGYEDLADPKWKGKLCLEDTDYEWFHGLLEHMGRERMLALFRRIAANQPSIRNGHGLLGDLVASGECPVAINNYGYQVGRGLKKGAPVDLVAVNPVITFAAAAAVSPKAPHPNAARLYVNWLVSEEGQKTLVGLGRFPVRSGLYPDPPRLLEGQQLKLQPPLEGEALRQAQALYRQVFQGR